MEFKPEGARFMVGLEHFGRPANRRGFGMAEVVVSTAIVGVMIVAALEAAGMVARTQRLNADRLTGPGLARDLLAEIMALPYVDPQTGSSTIGVDTGETSGVRSTFDDVDDYHGWSSSNAVAKNGTTRSGYAGWSQAVTVTWASRIDATAWSSYDTNLKRITVTVTSPAGVVTQLVGLRSRYGPLERSLPVAGTAVNWIGVELRAGASSRSQFLAAPLVNLSTDSN
jgi:MSHA pilin protein MshD